MFAVFKDSAIPREILTDRGTQFLSYLEEQLCSKLQIHHLKTPPNRPQSNDVFERLHATLTAIIKKACSSWTGHLSLTLLSLA